MCLCLSTKGPNEWEGNVMVYRILFDSSGLKPRASLCTDHYTNWEHNRWPTMRQFVRPLTLCPESPQPSSPSLSLSLHLSPKSQPFILFIYQCNTQYFTDHWPPSPLPRVHSNHKTKTIHNMQRSLQLYCM